MRLVVLTLILTISAHAQFPKYSSGGGGGSSSGGISDVNSQTGPSLTIASGTSGSDFGVATTSNTITVNCPTASGSVRGCLSSSDFTTFSTGVGNRIYTIPFGFNAVISTGLTQIVGPLGLGASATRAQRQIPVGISGTVIGVFATNTSSQSAGGALTCTVGKNTVATSMVISWSAGETFGMTKSDTTNTFSVAAGDTLDLSCFNAGSGSSAIFTGTFYIRQ